MADLSDYSENETLEWMFKDNSPSSHGNVYVSLHTADEGDSPDGSNEVDSGTTNYSRVQTEPGEWDISSSNDATEVENNTEVVFGDPDSEWGEVTHFTIWTEDEGVTGEEPLTATIELDESKTIDAEDDEVRFNSGALNFQLD